MRKFRTFSKKFGVMHYFDPNSIDQYASIHFYDIIHNTDRLIMQSIEIFDANHREIYEGDILDFDEDEWGSPFKAEVVPLLSEFVRGWPMSGCFADVSRWRKVITNVWEHKIGEHAS